MDRKRAGMALLLTLVAACGGAAPASRSGASPASSSSASPASSSGAAAAGGAGQPKLLDLLAAAKVTEYKVTYKLTATGAGAGFSGVQSWYFKPPRARFDFGMDMGGQKTTISFFSLPDGSYYCFGAGGTSQCFGIQGAGSLLDQNLAATFQRSLVDNPDQYGGTFTSAKTIAGQQGFCYDVKATATVATGLSSGSFCYSKEGIALLSQFGAGGSSWSMEATNVSTTVPDSDFALPAQPLGK